MYPVRVPEEREGMSMCTPSGYLRERGYEHVYPVKVDLSEGEKREPLDGKTDGWMDSWLNRRGMDR